MLEMWWQTQRATMPTANGRATWRTRSARGIANVSSGSGHRSVRTALQAIGGERSVRSIIQSGAGSTQRMNDSVAAGNQARPQPHQSFASRTSDDRQVAGARMVQVEPGAGGTGAGESRGGYVPIIKHRRPRHWRTEKCRLQQEKRTRRLWKRGRRLLLWKEERCTTMVARR